MSDKRSPEKLKNLKRIILGYIYIFWWVWRAKVRSLLARWAFGLLSAFLVLAVIEVILEIYGRGWGAGSSVVLRALFFSLITISLYSKIREWREHRQQFYFIQAAKGVVEILSTQAGFSQEDTIPRLLAIFAKTFERKGKGAPNANVALLDEQHKLRLKHWHPEAARYDAGFLLEEGEGGAGYCCAKRCVVYIPRKNLGHAIVQNIEDDQPYEMVANLFKPSHNDDFQATLSVPLVAYGTCFGALNFDSKKANPFHRLDFEQAMFYGLVVAQVLHIRQFGLPADESGGSRGA